MEVTPGAVVDPSEEECQNGAGAVLGNLIQISVQHTVNFLYFTFSRVTSFIFLASLISIVKMYSVLPRKKSGSCKICAVDRASKYWHSLWT